MAGMGGGGGERFFGRCLGWMRGDGVERNGGDGGGFWRSRVWILAVVGVLLAGVEQPLKVIFSWFVSGWLEEERVEEDSKIRE